MDVFQGNDRIIALWTTMPITSKKDKFVWNICLCRGSKESLQLPLRVWQLKPETDYVLLTDMSRVHCDVLKKNYLKLHWRNPPYKNELLGHHSFHMLFSHIGSLRDDIAIYTFHGICFLLTTLGFESQLKPYISQILFPLFKLIPFKTRLRVCAELIFYLAARKRSTMLIRMNPSIRSRGGWLYGDDTSLSCGVGD